MPPPHVTCVMTAFNYERYVAGALASVLAQDYPPDRLDVVVVDDGSTDGTAEAIRAVQARAGARVTLVQQPNAGLAAATDAALKRARGELVAICDADDEWLPGKVGAQVEIFASRPEVALVYGDMQVIDEEGSVLDSSFFRRQGVVPLRGRVLDQLIAVNFTTNSTLMLRAAHVVSIPACSPYADYWLAVHAAAGGDVEVIERPLASYRLHGSNMSFGVEGERLATELQRERMIRRLILTGELFRSVSLDTLVRAARECAPLEVGDDERARARRELKRGFDEQDPDERLRACARACLLDPSSITIAFAEELIAAPRLLAAYCLRVGSSKDATLVILADDSRLQETAQRLRESLIGVGVDPDDCPDMVIVPGSRVAPGGRAS